MEQSQTIGGSSPLAQIAVTALQGRLSKRVRWALTAYTVGHLGWQHGRQLWGKVRDRSRYWVGYLTGEQLVDMFGRFMRAPLELPWVLASIEARGLTPADVVDVLKLHVEDVDEAADAVRDLIESRKATA